MINKILIPACFVMMTLFSGCVTKPQIPADLQYSPPPAGVSVATIRGSGKRSTLLDDFTAYIVTIDGKLVMAGRKGWDTPIPITAGRHLLNVKFARGVFYAREEFVLNAVAGANYQLRYVTDVQLGGDNSYVDFWIVDMATSKAVSPLKQVSVEGDDEGPGYVPIFIPTK